MINQIGQVMLYVNDVLVCKDFWINDLGFILVKDEMMGPIRAIEVAPKEMQTSFVLMNKEIVQSMSPELDFGTPSIMFYATNLEKLYEDFKQKGVTVGELVTMPMGKVFNFSDPEGHYFAVLEK